MAHKKRNETKLGRLRRSTGVNAIAAGLLALWGCGNGADRVGDGASSGGSGGAQGGTGGSGGTPTDGGVVSISGIARDWSQSDPFATPPLAGVRVCLYLHAEVPCVTTDTTGEWKLQGAPADAEVMVTFEKTGYLSGIRPIVTANADVVLQSFEGAMATAGALGPVLPGVTVDASKGGIVFFVNRPGTRFANIFDWLTGFTVDASPKSGNGPLYLDRNEVLVSQATSSQGGFGVYVNLSAGTYTLTFAVPAGVSCTTWSAIHLPEAYGYPAGQTLTVRVPVVPGYVTTPIGFYCPTVPVTDAGSGRG